MSLLPKNRPQYKREDAEQVIKQYGFELDKLYLIGFRGYWKITMGNPTRNDRGIFDDAIIAISPNYYATFNANVDPSQYKQNVANLIAGVWEFKIGTHNISKAKSKQYKALVQGDNVFGIKRDGKDKVEYTAWNGINIHKATYTTSSLGCQTIPTQGNQWNEFISNVESQMKQYNQKEVKYILIDL